jgi:hypothetical protein
MYTLSLRSLQYDVTQSFLPPAIITTEDIKTKTQHLSSKH